ncbi:MAG TPA: nucleotide exchange factor GrpE [Mycobacteriales bacterium]|nr:nucleotide exchange factor GrpE [Mycobacteriales bacterium]
MAEQNAPQPEPEAAAAERPETERRDGRAEAEPADELRARLADLEHRYRQALADFDNFRKRMAREVERQRAEERARVAAQWLPVLDDLDRALEHAEANPGAIVEGVRAVRDEAVALLARLGFPRRSDLGEPFDPARHEAVATVPDAGGRAGTVVHVVRPRYGDDERQLRPAAVVVARSD